LSSSAAHPEALGRAGPRAVMPAVAGTLAFFAIAAAGLTWAKWAPYGHELVSLWGRHVWRGKDMLASAGHAGAAPSVSGAWRFTRAYGADVWPAVIAALVMAAAVDSFVPRRWLLRVMAQQGRYRGSLVGGLLALPCLMCTCCTAPVAATLRRGRVPTSAALAYWIGNPVLNPAVLAFLALVAPWQWVAVRIAVGVPLVFGATGLVARLARSRDDEAVDPRVLPAFELRRAPAGFLRSLTRIAATLLPEYLLVVFMLGLFRGWLFPLDASAAHLGILALFAAAALGTLVVVPTGGEIPITQGLAAAGVSLGTVGALLITLPAISLVSMAMVVRAFSARVTSAMAGAVAVSGLLGGVLLWALG
jgi:uncharacterized membrane protein YraQ (UPF0718 family)